MIDRYITEEMTKIWSKENRFTLWLKFQIDVCQALKELNIISEDDFSKIKANTKLDLPLMDKLEQQLKHDVVAFTRMLSANLQSESRWIHYGLTSTDMVDSVQNYQIKLANQIIDGDLVALQKQLKDLAMKYKEQLIIGRTHGIFAEPTSLGLKFALWYDELNRQIARFKLAREQIEVVKITGSVGNFAHVSPKVSEIVAQSWDMKVDSCATQVVQRDRHAFLLATLANIASTIEKIALEIRLSQRSEVNELLEGFSNEQKGSSSMPHKKNPIASENIMGLARLIRSYVSVGYENNLLWYERDISHSSNERIIFPDVYHSLDFIAKRMTELLTNLVVNTQAMNDNLKQANNIYFSQPVLLAIIKNNPELTREEAYDFVQKVTLTAQKENQDFKIVLKENGVDKYLSDEQLNQCYNEKQFLSNVDYIFNKVFK
ncbi:adenylosuccinate lyase [Spiroplasma platyhelix]|uniref:Adenylosuccinate lyase n=1 Tax=Spiroplasma platyhelix PALS-1 TaxID=1276218 RepID=A0A846U9J3_9MOLU|nr:adenylosuccinate lyase [Spiroplasma platyhelix]MBE4704170.1 Adenylosuccinate lyase [Spiroplasma platyhelix PALS-1]NKE38543.1 adenylosuccinate lyase [Spiroplasma platyhelix PALS-1]UJB29428.1 adenylosuccinate lyase [Spiroplasma platyhelix PALS-1]